MESERGCMLDQIYFDLLMWINLQSTRLLLSGTSSLTPLGLACMLSNIKVSRKYTSLHTLHSEDRSSEHAKVLNTPPYGVVMM